MRIVHSDVSLRSVSRMRVLRCCIIHAFCYMLVALVAQAEEAINLLKRIRVVFITILTTIEKA